MVLNFLLLLLFDFSFSVFLSDLSLKHCDFSPPANRWSPDQADDQTSGLSSCPDCSPPSPDDMPRIGSTPPL